VTYQRMAVTVPRLVSVHAIVVELDTEGVSFLVTPPDPGDELPLQARTTSSFLEEFGVQVAINANFFRPFRASRFSYYPHAGDRVGVRGLAASRGKVYSGADPDYLSLLISGTNRASLGSTGGKIWNAISGRELIVRDGRVQRRFSWRSRAHQPHPRTVVALDRERGRLFLVVADGRQAGTSEGLTLPEIGRLVVELGAADVLHLDGGGPTTLVIEGSAGRAEVLNSPIHQGEPGSERPVANHIGVYAPAINGATSGSSVTIGP